MKHIVMKIALVLALPLLFACSQKEYQTPDATKVPKAAELVVSTSIDETNIVTFHLANEACIPIWIFGENDMQTGNDITRRFAAQGTYNFEVKAYNANGISDGSQVCQFVVEQTWTPPFDPAPYVALLSSGSSKVWTLDAATQGHLGCGESGSNGLGWWSAAPNDKAAFSVYDNLITFGSDLSYTFDPVDGQTYVNKDAGYKPEFKTADEDYVAPIDVQNATYALSEEDGQIYITFPQGITTGYIPNAASLTNPRYKVLSITAKSLELVYDEGSIAWHYLFKVYDPSGSLPDAEKLAGTSSKNWVIDYMTWSHIACGEPGTDGTGWWAAQPLEKNNYGLYDDVLTFSADGSYTYNPGPSGTIYVNKDSGFHSEIYIGDGNDYEVPVEVQTATWTLNDDGITKTLVFPANTLVGYVPNPEALANPSYRVLTIENDKLEIVVDNGGIAWHFIFVPEGTVSAGAEVTAEAYAANILGSWRWEYEVAGHFGCGDAITNPIGWWACEANGKAGFSLYDDIITFTADEYTFDPVDGKTYVNSGVNNYHPESKTDEDFVAPAEVQTTTWEIVKEGDFNCIKLPANTLLSYLANDEQLTNPQYYITGMWQNRVDLVWFTPTGNGGGAIAWLYRMRRVVR